jgi:outer membrane protein assembly factor BamB
MRSIVRRLVMSLAGALLLSAPLAPWAGALPAAPAAATLALSPTVGPPTTVLLATGAGFGAGEIAALYFDGARIGSVRASRGGAFRKQVSVSASAQPGSHALKAVGLTSRRIARATFLVRTDWTQSCFDPGHSCFNPYENVLDPEDVDQAAMRWDAVVGTSGETSALYDHGTLFVGGPDGVAGLDPATGAIIINYKTGGPVVTNPAILKGFDPQPDPPGKVIVGSKDGTLSAFDQTDDFPVWQVALGAEPTSPLVIQGVDQTDDKVLVGAGDVLSAFDGDGMKLWATSVAGGDISPGGPVMIDQTDDFVAVSAGNVLTEVDAHDGRIMWSNAFSRSPLVAASMGSTNLLVGDEEGVLYAIDPTTGNVLDAFRPGGAIAGLATIWDPTMTPSLFVGDGGGNIYAFDQVEEFPPPIWQAALGTPIGGPPVIANGVLYALTDPDTGDPALFALDAATGRVLFRDALKGGSAAAPMVADGMVVIGIRTGEVLEYEGPDT